MERFYNYRNMSLEQRKFALNSLSSIGFFPAYGSIKTMRRIMDKAFGEKMPQFYFVFREKELIGYMFLIGNDKMFRAFPNMRNPVKKYFLMDRFRCVQRIQKISAPSNQTEH